MPRFTLLLLLSATTALFGQIPGTIETVVGTGVGGFSGDGGPATAAQIRTPTRLAFERGGGFVFADLGNDRIRRVRPDGGIETVAGNGTPGFSGDGGPATAASLNEPTGVAVSSAGDVYIADASNNRIRMVDSAGVITTVAGSGVRGFSGDGGPATAAQLACPTRIAFDAFDNLYIADQCNHRIRRVDRAGVITTVVGSGTPGAQFGAFSGDGGPALSAQFQHPTALALDGAGAIYISDQLNHRIRKVFRNGTVTTLAGTGASGFSGDGGPADQATMGPPGAVAVDAAGNVFFGDTANNRVRRIGIDGMITTVAGTGAAATSGDGGPATSAGVHEPFGVELDAFGNLYIMESGGHRIRKVTSVGSPVPTFSAAGVTNGASFLAGGVSPGSIVSVFLVDGLASDAVLVADSLPLPTSLGGTSVTVDGTPAPLFAVVNRAGQVQINLLFPLSTQVAQSAATADIVVTTNGRANLPVATPVAAAQPGVFLLPPSGDPAIVRSSDNTVITAQNPIAKDDVVTIFLTGMGAVDNPPAPGAPAPGVEPLARTAAFPTLTIGGAAAEVFFSGLTPGLAGLYQINARVPQAAPSGAAAVVVTQAGASSPAVNLAVQ